MLYLIRLLIITIAFAVPNFSSFKLQLVSGCILIKLIVLNFLIFMILKIYQVAQNSKLSRRFSQVNNNIGNFKPVLPKVELEKQFEIFRRILSFASFASIFATCTEFNLVICFLLFRLHL